MEVFERGVELWSRMPSCAIVVQLVAVGVPGHSLFKAWYQAMAGRHDLAMIMLLVHVLAGAREICNVGDGFRVKFAELCDIAGVLCQVMFRSLLTGSNAGCRGMTRQKLTLPTGLFPGRCKRLLYYGIMNGPKGLSAGLAISYDNLGIKAFCTGMTWRLTYYYGCLVCCAGLC